MKLTLVLMILIVTHGCTFKKLAIQNAHQLIYFYSLKKLPLNKQQKHEYKEDLAKFINRHRSFIKEELSIVLNSINPEDLQKIENQYHKIESIYLNLAGNFSEILAGLIADFNDKQQTEFFKTLNEDNSKIRKKIEERDPSTLKKTFKMFIGNLNEKQISILRTYSLPLKEQSFKRLERRKNLHEKLKFILDQKNGGERRTAIHEAFIQYQNEVIKESNYLEIIKSIIPTLDKEQIKHFKNYIAETKELIEYL